MLPGSIAEKLKIHLQGVKVIHNQVLEKGYGLVDLPIYYKMATISVTFRNPSAQRCQNNDNLYLRTQL